MRIYLLGFVLYSAMMPAFAASTPGPDIPPGVDCTHVVSVPKTFGGTQWNAIGCKDGKTLVIVSAQDNPAFPFYFTVFQQDGAYRVTGEGTGSKPITDLAYAEISKLSSADIQAIIQQSLAVPSPAPAKTCAEMLPITVENLSGTWVSVDDPNQITVQYNTDGSFTGRAMQGHKILWLFAGTWKLEGTKVSSVYTFSSLDRIPKGTTDSDEILGIGCGVQASRGANGLVERYRKIKD